MKKYLFSLLLCFLLTACTDTLSKDLVKGTEGFVTMIDGEQLLIADVLYKVTDETELVDAQNKEVAFEDFAIGNKVIPYYDGVIAESYPGQANALKLELIVDAKPSKEVIEKIVAFADENVQKPVILKKVTIDEEKQVVIATINSITSPDPVELEYSSDTDTIRILD